LTTGIREKTKAGKLGQNQNKGKVSPVWWSAVCQRIKHPWVDQIRKKTNKPTKKLPTSGQGATANAKKRPYVIRVLTKSASKRVSWKTRGDLSSKSQKFVTSFALTLIRAKLGFHGFAGPGGFLGASPIFKKKWRVYCPLTRDLGRAGVEWSSIP